MGESPRIDSLKTLGRYALIERVSDGYLGPVYRSFDQDLNRAVEILVFRDGIRWDPDFVELFRGECDAVARLRHPNIASVIELGSDGGFPHMVLEPLGSRNLRFLFALRPELPFETKISIMMQAAEGLGFAHANGVVHRNLCPENIYLAADGVIKIRDFSIAHLLMKRLPHPALRWGAPLYLSPEQIRHRRCDEQSDIFAAGIVFYELLTGVHPFYHADGNKALDNILQDRPIATFERYPNVHPRIWHILKTCLAGRREDRYESAAALLDAFRGLVEEMDEDVRLMLGELQAAFAALKTAAARPDASDRAAGLCKNVWRLLRGDDRPGYAHLDRLIADLNAVYPEIQAEAGDPNAPVAALYGGILTEGLPPLPHDGARPAPGAPAGGDAVDRAAAEDGPRHGEEAAPAEDPAREAIPVLGDAPPGRGPAPGSVAAEDPPGPGDFPPEEIPAGVARGTDWEEPGPEGPPIPGDCRLQGSADPEPPAPGHRLRPSWMRPGIPRPGRRTVAVLVLVLLAVAAVGAAGRSGGAGALLRAGRVWMLDSWATVLAATSKRPPAGEAGGPAAGVASIVVRDSGSAYESELFDGLEATYPGEDAAAPDPEAIDRIAGLIRSGDLRQAEAGLDQLRRVFPDAPEVEALYGQWRQKASRPGPQGNGPEEARTEPSPDREAAWRRQFDAFFSGGQYAEAGNVAGLWMRDAPGSAGAREAAEEVRKIRSRLAAGAAAADLRRYGEALAELDAARRINPADPGIAALREEVESRMASARCTLTVLRLGEPAAVLLDGQRIGDGGEVHDARIPIGLHAVAIEKDGFLAASTSQQFSDGQSLVLVYDLVRGELRPLVEADRKILDQRRAIETVHSFAVEHSHGFLRGSCRGELQISHAEVVYRPLSGPHGFQAPLKILDCRRDGKSIRLRFDSGNELFHKFEFELEEDAVRFSQTWKELKSLPQR